MWDEVIHHPQSLRQLKMTAMLCLAINSYELALGQGNIINRAAMCTLAAVVAMLLCAIGSFSPLPV
jgi:hypothetical protein